MGVTSEIDADALREYCRRVEDHLTRVNGGHLVRIVGPGFALVREWAEAAVPLSVVFQGIAQKAERHKAGRSTRPLRLEFCKDDVRALYDDWRRAVGIFSGAMSEKVDESGAAQGAEAEAGHEKRQPSLAKHLERVSERLSRAAGRLDLAEALRDAIARWLDEITNLRGESRHLRGTAREPLLARLEALDGEVGRVARSAVSTSEVARFEHEAERDLAAYRVRLASDVWRRSVDVTTDRLIRESVGLPSVTFTGGAA